MFTNTTNKYLRIIIICMLCFFTVSCDSSGGGSDAEPGSNPGPTNQISETPENMVGIVSVSDGYAIDIPETWTQEIVPETQSETSESLTDYIAYDSKIALTIGTEYSTGNMEVLEDLIPFYQQKLAQVSSKNISLFQLGNESWVEVLSENPDTASLHTKQALYSKIHNNKIKQFKFLSSHFDFSNEGNAEMIIAKGILQTFRTVTKESHGISSFLVSPNSVTLSIGQTVTPTITILPKRAPQAVFFEISDPTIVTQNNQRSLTATDEGETTVTIKSYDDPTYFAPLKIIVTGNDSGLEKSPEDSETSTPNIEPQPEPEPEPEEQSETGVDDVPTPNPTPDDSINVSLAIPNAVIRQIILDEINNFSGKYTQEDFDRIDTLTITSTSSNQILELENLIVLPAILKNLKHLILENVKLNSFKNLNASIASSLESFTIKNNKILRNQEQVKFVDLPEMPRLKKINIENYPLDSFQALVRHSALEEITVFYGRLYTGLGNDIRYFLNTQELNALSNLKYLNLKHIKCSGLEMNLDLSQLETLELDFTRSNNFGGKITFSSSMTRLESAIIEGYINIKSVENLKNLTGLVTFSFQGRGIYNSHHSDLGEFNAPNLEVLTISDFNLEKIQNIKGIGNSKSLKKLTLKGANVNDLTFFENFPETFKKLNFISLGSKYGMQDAFDLSPLSFLTEIETIDIYQLAITELSWLETASYSNKVTIDIFYSVLNPESNTVLNRLDRNLFNVKQSHNSLR